MNTHCCESEETIEGLFKAVSHPARLAILEEMRQGECCVCHLEAFLGSRQAYISQQLAVLRDAGLISDRRDGWNVYYRVNDPRVFDLLNTAYTLTNTHPEKRIAVKACNCKYCLGKENSVSE
jgi:DNA-binding transcriptional ArsR family regulator